MLLVKEFGWIAVGGETHSRTRLSTLEIFDQEKFSWESEMTDLGFPVSRHCAVAVNRKEVFIIGGFMDANPFSDQVIRLYVDPFEASPVASRMKTGRQLHSCATINSRKIIVVGGRNFGGFLKSVEVFDAMTLRWTEVKHLELPNGLGHTQLLPLIDGKHLNHCMEDIIV